MPRTWDDICGVGSAFSSILFDCLGYQLAQMLCNNVWSIACEFNQEMIQLHLKIEAMGSSQGRSERYSTSNLRRARVR